MNRLATSSIAF